MYVSGCKPNELTYELVHEKAVFETQNGRLELRILPKTKSILEQIILEREAGNAVLGAYEILKLYKSVDANNDNIITPTEAETYARNARASSHD